MQCSRRKECAVVPWILLPGPTGNFPLVKVSSVSLWSVAYVLVYSPVFCIKTWLCNGKLGGVNGWASRTLWPSADRKNHREASHLVSLLVYKVQVLVDGQLWDTQTRTLIWSRAPWRCVWIPKMETSVFHLWRNLSVCSQANAAVHIWGPAKILAIKVIIIINVISLVDTVI